MFMKSNEFFAQIKTPQPQFVPVSTLEDVQAMRCAEFHPNGKFYAVGSNSKTMRVCAYPLNADKSNEPCLVPVTVLIKRTKHHKGSIYCMAWSPDGELLATGSNDRTIKLLKFDEDKCLINGPESELNMHDGTIREMTFIEDTINRARLLISGGAGNCNLYATDCERCSILQAFKGHKEQIRTLYNWGGATFVSGSQDKTVRFWDLRVQNCTRTIALTTNLSSKQGSPVSSVCVDPSGRLLLTGHEDSSSILFDIRGDRVLQCFKPHSAEIRSIRLSPSAYYMLSCGYDNKVVLTDLQGDLTLPLSSVTVAHHKDKVISGRWHPTEFSFITTSADKTCTLWDLTQE